MFPDTVFVIDGYRERGSTGLIQFDNGDIKSVGWFRTSEAAEKFLTSMYSERRRFFKIIETTMAELYDVRGYRWCTELGQKRVADPPVLIRSEGTGR